MTPRRHSNESVVVSVFLALALLVIYVLALVYLIWVMTPGVFGHLVLFLQRFTP